MPSIQPISTEVVSQKTLESYSTNDSLNVKRILHPDIEVLKPLILKELENEVDGNFNSSNSNWTCMVDNYPTIQVFQNNSDENFLKVLADLPNSSATSFDLFYDICRRPFWDDLCEKAEIIEEIDYWSRIIYLQMKPIWPSSARDIVLLSYIENLGEGKYLMIAKSVSHPKMPEAPGFVRMNAKCIVQLFIPSGDNKCRLIQMAHGDPGGWIPKSVVRYVSTKAIPYAFRKISEIIFLDPTRTESSIFDRINSKLSDESQIILNTSTSEFSFEERVTLEVQLIQKRLDKMELELDNLLREFKGSFVSGHSQSSNSSLIKSFIKTNQFLTSLSPLMITSYIIYNFFKNWNRR